MSKPDDSYTSDGQQMNGIYYPETSTEGEIELAAEQGKLSASFPVLDDLIDWFDAEIAKCDSIDNIQVTSLTINGVKYSRDVSVEGQILAYQLLKGLMHDKKVTFENFREETGNAS